MLGLARTHLVTLTGVCVSSMEQLQELGRRLDERDAATEPGTVSMSLVAVSTPVGCEHPSAEEFDAFVERHRTINFVFSPGSGAPEHANLMALVPQLHAMAVNARENTLKAELPEAAATGSPPTSVWVVILHPEAKLQPKALMRMRAHIAHATTRKEVTTAPVNAITIEGVGSWTDPECEACLGDTAIRGSALETALLHIAATGGLDAFTFPRRTCDALIRNVLMHQGLGECLTMTLSAHTQVTRAPAGPTLFEQSPWYMLPSVLHCAADSAACEATLTNMMCLYALDGRVLASPGGPTDEGFLAWYHDMRILPTPLHVDSDERDLHAVHRTLKRVPVHGHPFVRVAMARRLVVPEDCTACHACALLVKPAASGERPLLLCAACKKASYCSRTCQRAHWKTHKKTCGSAAAS